MGILKKPIEVFYPGNHTDYRGRKLSVGDRDLNESVRFFNSLPESEREIPFVVGHPSDESVNFGKATKLLIDNGVVKVAECKDLSPEFKAIVNSGELNNISAKLRLPGHPANKSSGVIEFAHIGFFGKSPVALGRLKSASFSRDDSNHEFCFMKSDFDDSELAAEFAAKEAALQERIKELELKEAVFNRRQSVIPEIDKLIASGKLLPAEKEGFISLFCSLPDDLEVAFSANKSISASSFLSQFLNNLKPRIEYRDIMGDFAPEAQFAMEAPKGTAIKKDKQDLYSRAMAYCEKKNLDPKNQADWMRAVEAVGGDD